MIPLADAATCRSESDWLIGINGTRAMTAFNSKTGGFHLTTVGRVQTPTLAILVEREERIKSSPRDYWGNPRDVRRAVGRIRRTLVRRKVFQRKATINSSRSAFGTSSSRKPSSQVSWQARCRHGKRANRRLRCRQRFMI